MASAQIVTLTMNPAIDTSSGAPRVVPEQKVRCRAPQYEPGGGGINVSYAIGKLGGDSLSVLPAGGPTGALLQELLRRRGMHCRVVDIGKWSRQNVTIADESGDQQFRFVMPGPEMQEAEWQECLDAVKALDPSPSYLVASGSLPGGVPTDFYARLAGMCRKRDIRLVLDTSGDPLREAMDEGVFLVKPNIREFRHLVGEDAHTDATQIAAARSMIEKGGCRAVVISLGAGGALLVSGDGHEHVRAPTVPISSKVGAGDSMVGGIVLALDRGMALPDAVRFGVAAGSAAVMTPGTQLCRREDTESLYEKMKN